MILQGSKEWLDLRRRHITATDAPVITGDSPFKSSQKLLDQKLGFYPADEITDRMRDGNRYEEEARQSFEKETGLIMFPMVKFQIEYKWMMASLDGINPEQDCIVEIKCGSSAYNNACKGIIAPYYMIQMQHQLAVTSADCCFFYCYNQKKKQGITFEVKPQPSEIDRILAAELEFWEIFSPLIKQYIA